MKQIYVLYTGGTIGMGGNPLSPMDQASFSSVLSQQNGISLLSEKGGTHFKIIWEHKGSKSDLFFKLDGLETPIDSSNITPSQWCMIARKILDNREDYDGFVILNGTDTMAWTASALSFLLQGFDKPVILTGSQIPLNQMRSDGLSNLSGAIIFASAPFNQRYDHPIREVCIYFGHQLIRGNRATKSHCAQFDGFSSPNYPILGQAGIDVQLYQNQLLKPQNVARTCLDDLCIIEKNIKDINVIPMTLFPANGEHTDQQTLHGHMLRTLVYPKAYPVQGIVLNSYGAGNVPDTPSFIKAIQDVVAQGVSLVNVTQCERGGVDMEVYEAASGIRDAGVLSGYDMTLEAAYAKLTLLIALLKDHPQRQSEINKRMGQPICGELTLF